MATFECSMSVEELRMGLLQVRTLYDFQEPINGQERAMASDLLADFGYKLVSNHGGVSLVSGGIAVGVGVGFC